MKSITSEDTPGIVCLTILYDILDRGHSRSTYDSVACRGGAVARCSRLIDEQPQQRQDGVYSN